MPGVHVWGSKGVRAGVVQIPQMARILLSTVMVLLPCHDMLSWVDTH